MWTREASQQHLFLLRSNEICNTVEAWYEDGLGGAGALGLGWFSCYCWEIVVVVVVVDVGMILILIGAIEPIESIGFCSGSLCNFYKI